MAEDHRDTDQYGANGHPQSVMTLDQAIATHPDLWAEMGRRWRRDDEQPEVLVLEGLILGLSIVGKFDTKDIEARLLEDFG